MKASNEHQTWCAQALARSGLVVDDVEIIACSPSRAAFLAALLELLATS